VQKKDTEWFSDESFWEQYAPIMFDDAHWAEVGAVADGVLNFAQIIPSQNPKILDLCCGFGRISAELARRGFAVTGVDITESYLRTAREDAAHENLDIEYINADARVFKRPLYFDLAVNLYISIGYFATREEDLLLLRNVCESLKKGGMFIIETQGKEIVMRDFVKTEHFPRAGFTVITEYKPLESWTFLENKWILVKDGKQIEKTFVQRLFTADELKALLLEAGFSSVDIFGDWDKSPYGEKAPKLIAVAKK
jgi:SAM-dependent methyltransferase